MTTPDHPLSETDAAELWEAHIPERKTEYLGWQSFPEPSRRCFTTILRAAYDAGREHERTTTPDPYHDHRYVPCGPEFHYQEPGGRRGIWDRQTGEVAWFSSPKDSPAFLTRLAERIDVGLDSRGEWAWSPAPTPPAEEVELPIECPAHITDVGHVSGGWATYMALDRDGFWTGVDGGGSACAWEGDDLTAFTLPDGTRARRDGEREDGTPRFIKVQEGEK